MIMLMEKTDLRVKLTPGLKQRFDALVDDAGMSQINGVNRLIEWFCSQDEVTRAVVLGMVPKSIAPDVARMVLERLANQSGAEREGPSISQSRIEEMGRQGLAEAKRLQAGRRSGSGAA